MSDSEYSSSDEYKSDATSEYRPLVEISSDSDTEESDLDEPEDSGQYDAWMLEDDEGFEFDDEGHVIMGDPVVEAPQPILDIPVEVPQLYVPEDIPPLVYEDIPEVDMVDAPIWDLAPEFDEEGIEGIPLEDPELGYEADDEPEPIEEIVFDEEELMDDEDFDDEEPEEMDLSGPSGNGSD